MIVFRCDQWRIYTYDDKRPVSRETAHHIHQCDRAIETCEALLNPSSDCLTAHHTNPVFRTTIIYCAGARLNHNEVEVESEGKTKGEEEQTAGLFGDPRASGAVVERAASGSDAAAAPEEVHIAAVTVE